MTRKWKPGEVAMVTIGRRFGDGSDESIYTAFFAGRYGWYGVTDGKGCGGLTENEHEFVITRRPLALIDPENREQVERLLSIYHAQYPFAHSSDLAAIHVDNMQAALREFADPTPQIEEPPNLGAVVEDANGVRWVRSTGAHEKSRWTSNLSFVTWADIDAVRLLSEGVATDA